MIIDKQTWKRKEVFDFFSSMSNPFYSVSFIQDVTPLYNYAKKHNISFYYAFIYVCTKAINKIEDFHYLLRDNAIHYVEERNPSFTDMRKGSELFHIVSVPLEEDILTFCSVAKKTSLSQTTFIDMSLEQDALIYYSCLPWIEMTAFTNERDLNPDDAVPRITWGKYKKHDNDIKLHLSLEVNHRFVDGYHIGLFHETLTALLQELT